MANNTTISNAAAIAMCNAIVDLLDGGTVKIYTGSQPAGPDTAVGVQTLLGTLTLGSPAFGDAVDANPGATATANSIADDSSADATGTAAWFRAATSGGTAVIDGSVGTSGADMNLSTTSIVAAAAISVTSWTVTQPET